MSFLKEHADLLLAAFVATLSHYSPCETCGAPAAEWWAWSACDSEDGPTLTALCENCVGDRKAFCDRAEPEDDIATIAKARGAFAVLTRVPEAFENLHRRAEVAEAWREEAVTAASRLIAKDRPLIVGTYDVNERLVSVVSLADYDDARRLASIAAGAVEALQTELALYRRRASLAADAVKCLDALVFTSRNSGRPKDFAAAIDRAGEIVAEAAALDAAEGAFLAGRAGAKP